VSGGSPLKNDDVITDRTLECSKASVSTGAEKQRQPHPGEGAHSHHGDGVVVEHSRDIFRWELVGRVADEKAGLADRTVADDNAPEKG